MVSLGLLVAVRSTVMTVSVCMSAYVRLFGISQKPHVQTSRNFLYMLSVVMARSSSDNHAIRYLFPVSWMASRFPIMHHMARGVGNIDVSAVLKQVVEISNVFARTITLFDFIVVYSGSKLRARGRSLMSTWLPRLYRSTCSPGVRLAVHVTSSRTPQCPPACVRLFTFRVSRRPREMYCGHARLCVCVCLSVCLSVAACVQYCMDPDVTWGSGRGCPLVVHYWADLQSVHGMRCYGNIMEMRGRAQR